MKELLLSPGAATFKYVAYEKLALSADNTNNRNIESVRCLYKTQYLEKTFKCRRVMSVAVWFAECNHAVRFAEREVLRNSRALFGQKMSLSSRARDPRTMTPGTAAHGHVTLLTRFLRTDRGRAHCHTDRSTRLFHLHRPPDFVYWDTHKRILHFRAPRER